MNNLDTILEQGLYHRRFDLVLASLVLGAKPTAEMQQRIICVCLDNPVVLRTLPKLGVTIPLDEHQYDAMWYCVSTGNPESLDLLLSEFHLNPDARTSNGNTILHTLASLRTIRWTQDCPFSKPLARKDLCRLVHILVSNRANPDLADEQGRSARELLEKEGVSIDQVAPSHSGLSRER